MLRVELMPAIAETHVCFSESNHRPKKTAASYARYLVRSSGFCVTKQSEIPVGKITTPVSQVMRDKLLTTARQMTTYGHNRYHPTLKSL